MVAIATNLLPLDCAGYNRTNLPGCDAEGLSVRSWKQFVQALGVEKATEQVNDLLRRHSLGVLLPAWEEWTQQLDTVRRFTGLRDYQLHVSFSSPVVYPGRLALSSLFKLYDDKRKQVIRIKISCFNDEENKLWWEVGFVHAEKSIKKESSFSSSKDSYFLLSELVANTYSFLKSRDFIYGIHLSPAYYHVMPLSQRITGQYPYRLIEELPGEWIDKLEKAWHHYCHDQEAAPCKTTSQKRFIISRLLQQGQLKDIETGDAIKWRPPAIVILNSKRH